MADQDYNVNIRFTEEETFSGDTGSRAGAEDTGKGTGGRGAGRGQDREASDRRRMFQQMEWVFRAFRGVPGVGIMGSIGKDIAVNARFSQQALGLQKGIGAGMIAGLAGVALTLFSLLKQSQVSTKFSAAFFQIIGAMIDMLLVPYIPLLSKVVEWLMKGFTWSAKYGQTIADLVKSIMLYLWNFIKLFAVANPITAAIILASEGFKNTAQLIGNILGGLQDAKDGMINATAALFDIGKREQLTEKILDRFKEAFEKGAPIANMSAAQEALLTMPFSILEEIMNKISDALEKSTTAKDGTVYLKEIAEIVNNLQNLKFPSMTATQSVVFNKQWQEMLKEGGKITPRDIVDLATANLIKISDIFNLAEKYQIKATSVIEVVGSLAKQANDIISIVKGSEIPVNLSEMTLKFQKAITVDADKIINIAKSNKTLADFIDTAHKLIFGSYVSETQLVLGDYIKDKDLLNDILTAAGVVLGGPESGVMGNIVTAASKANDWIVTLTGTIVDKITDVKNFFEKNIQPAASAVATFLGSAAELAAKIPGYVAQAIQTQVSAQVAQLTRDRPWGGVFPITPPTGGNTKGHTGRLITESGEYSLLRGERVVREGDTNRLVTVNNTITVISGGNQQLMPGILGRSLQASLMEGLENQLVRSLT